MLTDWGAHLLDTAQWANDTERTGPVEVSGTGKRFENGLYDTFYKFDLNYKYANGVEMEVHSGAVRLRFEGTDGWIGNEGWIGKLQASSPGYPEHHNRSRGNPSVHRTWRRAPQFPGLCQEPQGSVFPRRDRTSLLFRRSSWATSASNSDAHCIGILIENDSKMIRSQIACWNVPCVNHGACNCHHGAHRTAGGRKPKRATARARLVRFPLVAEFLPE